MKDFYPDHELSDEGAVSRILLYLVLYCEEEGIDPGRLLNEAMVKAMRRRSAGM